MKLHEKYRKSEMRYDFPLDGHPKRVNLKILQVAVRPSKWTNVNIQGYALKGPKYKIKQLSAK